MSNNYVEGKGYCILVYVLVFIIGVLCGIIGFYGIRSFVKSGIEDRKEFDRLRSSITTNYQYADNSINNKIKFL